MCFGIWKRKLQTVFSGGKAYFVVNLSPVCTGVSGGHHRIGGQQQEEFISMADKCIKGTLFMKIILHALL